MKKLPFTKMQGIGNDYVYINNFVEQIENPSDLARKISDRHFGVGSDGLVLIGSSAIADAAMRMFNADGSEAEMCGNASRCVGKFLYDNRIVNKDVIELETGAGIKTISLSFADGQVTGATVDMGEPVLLPELIPFNPKLAKAQQDSNVYAMEVGNREYLITPVSMGNPHQVLFMENIDGLDLPALGPAFERHPAFPKKTNTEFIEVLSKTRIKMRVWERGAGETLACGTGACAAAVACVLTGRTERKLTIELKGGALEINWDATNNHVYMTGPAVTVFYGQYLYS